MVVCVLIIACFVKIGACNPYIPSMTDNKFPTMTTSYATNMLPGEYGDYVSDIPLGITFPVDEIKLNYPNVLSRPMAITPVPIPKDLNTDAYIPEINVPMDYYAFNGYTPGISAAQTNLNFIDNPVIPKFTNDVPTPKYQYKQFPESFNTFRDNLFKSNELNLRGKVSPFAAFENIKSIDEMTFNQIYDIYESQLPPLKLPLKPQENYPEIPILEPSINYNDNMCQDKFDGQGNVRIKNEITSAIGPSLLSNIPFYGQGTSVLDDGNFLEEEIQMSRIPYYNKCNPFNSNVLNQQLLLNNLMLQEKQITKTDQNNLSRLDININVPNNNFNEKSIPIEITIIDTSDDSGKENTQGEIPCVTIDIYNENIEKNDCCNNEQQSTENNTKHTNLCEPAYKENITIAEENICVNPTTSIGYLKPSLSLSELSSYLAETILVALQSFIIEPVSCDNKGYPSNDTIKFVDKDAPCSNNSPSDDARSSIIPQSPEKCNNLNAKANKTEHISQPINTTEKECNPHPILSTNVCTSQSLQPANSTKNNTTCGLLNKTPIVTMRPNCTDEKVPEKTLNITTNSDIPANDSTSLPANNTKKACIVFNEIPRSPLLANNTNKIPEECPVMNTNSSIKANQDPQNSVPTNNTDKSNNLSNETSQTPPNTVDKTPEKPPIIATGTSVSINKTSPLLNNVVEKPEPEKSCSSKPQPCLSTITINVSPFKENNHHIVVFV